MFGNVVMGWMDVHEMNCGGNIEKLKYLSFFDVVGNLIIIYIGMKRVKNIGASVSSV